jgi:hypothetical protein
MLDMRRKIAEIDLTVYVRAQGNRVVRYGLRKKRLWLFRTDQAPERIFLRNQDTEFGFRIEVKDEKGEYTPVDYPLRAGLLTHFT